MVKDRHPVQGLQAAYPGGGRQQADHLCQDHGGLLPQDPPGLHVHQWYPILYISTNVFHKKHKGNVID